jgi:hypothetical protein
VGEESEGYPVTKDIIALDRLVTGEDRDILESTDFDVPLDQAGIEMNMPSDRPGVLMRRMLLKLERELATAAPARAAE